MIEDDFKALQELIKDIQEGKHLEVSKELWELAEAVCAAKGGPEEDLEAWAERLAGDLVEADD